MKNPFERQSSRLEEYEETQEKKEKMESRINDLEKPFIPNNWLLDNPLTDVVNAIHSLPSTPERKVLEMRVNMAQNKLEKIYEKDENEAHKLNEEYSKVVERAIETGDDTEQKKFEIEKLGMSDDAEDDK